MFGYLIVFSLLTLGALVGPESSSAGVPCQLNYSREAQVDWNGKTPGKNYSFNQVEVTVSVSDCVGITIKKGTVWALWYHKTDGPRHTVFPAGTKLTEASFENAQSGSLLKEFHEFVGLIGSFICEQCSDVRSGGDRGAFDSIEELLQSAFSGVLIFGVHETEIPFRVAGLRDLLSFRIFSGDATQQGVRGIRFTNKILQIPPFALEEGKSYMWEAEVGEPGRSQSYRGRFEVADDTLVRTTFDNLFKIAKASQRQIILRQQAAYYFEHGFPGNAIIALLQEMNESALGE
ncbi:MAG: hypothetical protein U0236_17230 [Nitrospira sp.]